MTNKTRVLALLQYLQEETDDGREVTNTDIRKHFAALGEKVSIPTIRDDIASLRQAGYEIEIREVNGVSTYYKYTSRPWTVPELQILVDAVASSLFISAGRSEQMIQKLRKMAGPTEGEQLQPGILVPHRAKASNENIIYIIQVIKDAILSDERIIFRHYEYNEDLELVPKHNGYEYEVSPYALIWKQDRYYLVGWSEKHNDVAHFRIDRMGSATVFHTPRRPAPPDLHLEDRSDKIFSMFDGPEQRLTLRCIPSVIGQVVDQFGEKLEIRKTKRGYLDVTVTVHLSPTFYGWLAQYSGEMTIVEPEGIREEYARFLQTAIDDVLGD